MKAAHFFVSVIVVIPGVIHTMLRPSAPRPHQHAAITPKTRAYSNEVSHDQAYQARNHTQTPPLYHIATRYQYDVDKNFRTMLTRAEFLTLTVQRCVQLRLTMAAAALLRQEIHQPTTHRRLVNELKAAHELVDLGIERSGSLQINEKQQAILRQMRSRLPDLVPFQKCTSEEFNGLLKELDGHLTVEIDGADAETREFFQ